jgi:hypothetical protein
MKKWSGRDDGEMMEQESEECVLRRPTNGALRPHVIEITGSNLAISPSTCSMIPYMGIYTSKDHKSSEACKRTVHNIHSLMYFLDNKRLVVEACYWCVLAVIM